MDMKNKLPPTLLMLVLSLSGLAQKQDIMLLGIYHFDNPGKDAYNVEIDDYFSERRQEEIKEVVAKLAEYKPTKILVELLPDHQTRLDSLYLLYTNKQLVLESIPGGRNEVYQLGFRLAKQLGLTTPKAIDHEGFYLGDYVDFIADTLDYAKYKTYQALERAHVEERVEVFQSNSVLENLLYMNDWKQVLANHHYYNNVAVEVRDDRDVMFTYQTKNEEIDGVPYFMRSFDFNEIGIEMITEWYKRNLFIYRSILDNSEENDRILVIFGSGHIRYLHQLFNDNPTYNITDPYSHLKR